MIQRADEKRNLGSAATAEHGAPPRSYRVELPVSLLDEQNTMLDWVIDYVFGALAAQHLDLRIVPAASPPSSEPVGPAHLQAMYAGLGADDRASQLLSLSSFLR